MWNTIRLSLVWTALALSALGASAQGFPMRPVSIVVPQTPGGASDTLARLVAQKLQEQWKQPVIVENRAGAGGNVGMQVVATAPADGYTLLMSYVGTHAINGSLYKKLSFNPETDFAPVATLATLPFVAVSRADSPIRTVSALVRAARDGRVTYGSAGNGSVNHLLGEMLNTSAGINMTHVPYRSAAPAIQDLMAGQIDVVFASMPSVSGAIKQGRLQAIALTRAMRSPAFPQIPTIAESGFPDFDVNPWFGLFVPAGTPARVVQKINSDVNALLKTPDLIEKFAAQGAEPLATSPAQFARMLSIDIEKWSAVVKSSGAHVD